MGEINLVASILSVSHLPWMVWNIGCAVNVLLISGLSIKIDNKNIGNIINN